MWIMYTHCRRRYKQSVQFAFNFPFNFMVLTMYRYDLTPSGAQDRRWHVIWNSQKCNCQFRINYNYSFQLEKTSLSSNTSTEKDQWRDCSCIWSLLSIKRSGKWWRWQHFSSTPFQEAPYTCSLFTLRKARSQLRINAADGERVFLRVNRQCAYLDVCCALDAKVGSFRVNYVSPPSGGDI